MGYLVVSGGVPQIYELITGSQVAIIPARDIMERGGEMKPPRKVEITFLGNGFVLKVEKGGFFPENTIEELWFGAPKELLKYLRGLYKNETILPEVR